MRSVFIEVAVRALRCGCLTGAPGYLGGVNAGDQELQVAVRDFPPAIYPQPETGVFDADGAQGVCGDASQALSTSGA